MSIVFEDIFELRQLNPKGKKFEKINRLYCKGTSYDVDLIVDVNCELFELQEGERMNFALATSIKTDGSADDGVYNPHPGPTLMDSYDYVMHGRIYNIEQKKAQTIDVFASFGGLLMQITGEQSQLELLQPDMKLHMLMRNGGLDAAMEMDN